MDADGYPEQNDLKRIEKWPYKDLGGLMDFVQELWRYAEDGHFDADGRAYRLSTPGRSGNEYRFELPAADGKAAVA